MLDDILTQESVQYIECVESWKEAVVICVQPLIDQGKVDCEYISAVNRNIERYGSNFVIYTYIILPHARPEQGVKENAVSILLTKTPFHFDDNKTPVRLVIVMAPMDSKSHLQILKEISGMLYDRNSIQSIMESKSKGQLYQRIRERIGKEVK